MTPRRPTPHRSPACCTLLAGVLAAMEIVGCTDPPAVTPDAARKDVAAEAGDLGRDVLMDVPGDRSDEGSDRVDARADVGLDGVDAGEVGPEVVFEDAEFLFQDAPPGYDIQFDRSGDGPAMVTLALLDVAALLVDGPLPDVPGVPCTPGTNETCACTDGREGWQVCERTALFSACMCDTLPPPPFPLPPRLVFPPNGSRVTSQRPTVRWALPAGLTGARVELCADRPCSRVLVRQEVADTSWRPAARLSPGVVFWRVQGLDAGGATMWTSATWYFQVRARDSAVDTAYGRTRDFNGDGYDDLVVAARDEFWLFLGSPAGLGATPAVVLRLSHDGMTTPTVHSYTTADLTGDGLNDLVAGQAEPIFGAPIAASIYAGDSRFPLGRRTARINNLNMGVNAGVPPTDHDGDGYLDLILEFRAILRGGPAGGIWRRVDADRQSYAGSPLDLDRDGYVEYAFYPSVRWAYGRLPLPTSARLPLPDLFLSSPCDTATGDFNGDQFGDMVGLCSIHEGSGAFHRELVSVFGGQNTLRRGALRLASLSGPVVGWHSGPQGDVDGDGYVDLVIAHDQSGIYWFRGGPQGVSTPPHAALTATGMSAIACVGDLNGDGSDETAFVSCSGEVNTLSILEGGSTWSGRVTRIQLPNCPNIE